MLHNNNNQDDEQQQFMAFQQVNWERKSRQQQDSVPNSFSMLAVPQEQWVSSNQTFLQPPQLLSSGRSLVETLEKVYTNVENDFKMSILKMQQSLATLSLDCCMKLKEMKQKQLQIVSQIQPSPMALDDFNFSATRIMKRSTNVMNNAESLKMMSQHLNILLSFVSQDGPLHTLVMMPSSSSTSPSTSPLSFSKSPPLLPPSLTPNFLPSTTQTSLPNTTSTPSSSPTSSPTTTSIATLPPPPSPPQTTLVLQPNCHTHIWQSPLLSTSTPFSTSSLSTSSSLSWSSQLPHTNPNRQDSTCFVFYLPPSIKTNDQLKDLFKNCGTVLNAFLCMDKGTNRTRGFGFVDFSSSDEANRAVQQMDKYPIDGKFLSVSIKIKHVA